MTREKAIEVIEGRFGIMDYCESRDLDDALDVAIEALKADAVPVVHGHWERKYSRPGVYADLLWHCSVCSAKFRDNWADHYKRCPECGAVMDGKDGNDENA